MNRALILVPVALALLSAPLPAATPGKVPRVGILRPGSPPDAYDEAFRQGLRELGYIEGQNIAFEYRWAEGRAEQLPDLAAELVRLNVDVLVATSSPGSSAAKQATATIPIVMVNVGDPVGIGLIHSLARPGGNITGLSLMTPELTGKRLELLKEVLPKVSRVAVLANPANPIDSVRWREAQTAGRALKVQLQRLEVRGPNEIDGAFAAAAKGRAGGLLVPTDSLFLTHRTEIVALAAKDRLPAMYGFAEWVRAGGLMAYGPSARDNYRRAATYVDKILKGTKPTDLPVEQPMRFELVVNMKTAKALGLTFPPSILIRTDQVIQ